jgi:hypothetical protein
LADSVEAELPVVMTGKIPEVISSKIGSGNYDTPPKALFLGGVFDDATIEKLRKAVQETPGARRMPWLRVDSSKPAPPIGPEYGKAVVARAKETLERLEKEGILDSNTDPIILF